MFWRQKITKIMIKISKEANPNYLAKVVKLKTYKSIKIHIRK
jgi:hypothetical protein